MLMLDGRSDCALTMQLHLRHFWVSVLDADRLAPACAYARHSSYWCQAGYVRARYARGWRPGWALLHKAPSRA